MDCARRAASPPAPPDSFEVSADGHAAVASLQTRSIGSPPSPAAVDRAIAASAEPSLVRFQPDGKQLIAGSAPAAASSSSTCPRAKPSCACPCPSRPAISVSTCGRRRRRPAFRHRRGHGRGGDRLPVYHRDRSDYPRRPCAGAHGGHRHLAFLPPGLQSRLNSVTVLNVDTRKLVAVVRWAKGPAKSSSLRTSRRVRPGAQREVRRHGRDPAGDVRRALGHH